MAYDDKAAERVRRELSVLPDVSERKMMGALVFMVGGHMCCGVTGDALMVRVGPAAYEAALKEPHVGPLNIGGGRQPRAFVCIEPKGFTSSKALSKWTRRGVDFVATLPAKDKSVSSPKSKKPKARKN